MFFEAGWELRLLSVLPPENPAECWLRIGSFHMFGGWAEDSWSACPFPNGGSMTLYGLGTVRFEWKWRDSPQQCIEWQWPLQSQVSYNFTILRMIFPQVWSTWQRNEIQLAGASSYQPWLPTAGGECSANMCVLWWCSQPIVDVFLFPCVRIPYSQWIGVRENLQETIDFPIKYVVLPVKFPLNQSIDIDDCHTWDCYFCR